MRKRIAAFLFVAAVALASRGQDAFDPARHMRVSDVREGMTGYGLSVFKGTKIDRFDVKVVSVLHNYFNPKYDIVLIECKGMNLEHTGAVAGMSGSPVFLKDDQGRERMIGAFAFGFPMAKDPVAGVQPIEYMLAIREGARAEGGGANKLDPRPRERGSWHFFTEAGAFIRRLQSSQAVRPDHRLLTGDGDGPRLRPLATPLMTGGLSPQAMERVAPVFNSYGLVPMNGGGAGAPRQDAADVKLEPGSVLGVPLITGDIEMTALGTCTELLEGRVWGFGHAFMNEGPVKLPLGSGQVNAIIANLTTSMKIGSLLQVRGTLTADQNAGVTGRTGEAPPMVPMEVSLVYAGKDGEQDHEQNYRLGAVSHPKLTGMATAAAIQAVISANRELPHYHTIDYDLTMEFEGGRKVRLNNRSANAAAQELFFEVGMPIMSAADNPFERVMLTGLKGTVRVTPQARLAQILSVRLPKTKYQPGEKAKLFVTYRPFRGEESFLPIDFEIPRDLPDGNYQLGVSDWDTHLQQEQAAGPFRFAAQTADELFDVLKDVLATRRDALYVRLTRQTDGVAVGRTAMPRLPSSRRQVLLGAGLSNTTAFVSSTVKVVPAEMVMDGAASFAVTVAREAKVDSKPPAGAAAKNKPETSPPPPADTERKPED